MHGLGSMVLIPRGQLGVLVASAGASMTCCSAERALGHVGMSVVTRLVVPPRLPRLYRRRAQAEALSSRNSDVLRLRREF